MSNHHQGAKTIGVHHAASAEPLDPLAGTPYERQPLEIERLSGGASAFTYRVNLTQSEFAGEAASVILKVFQSTLAITSQVELGIERMLYECAALKALGARREVYDNVSVEAPKLLFEMQGEHNVVGMSDAGQLSNLRDWFDSQNSRARPPQQRAALSRAIGQALAQYLSNLHISSKKAGSSCADLKDQILAMGDNSAMKSMTSRTFYGARLEQSVPDAEPSILSALRQAARQGEEDVLVNEVLLHGDFGPRNVLIDDSSVDSIKLYLVDWEACRTGTAAFDVGLFAAEALCIQEFHDGVGGAKLLASFLETFGILLGPNRHTTTSSFGRAQDPASTCSVQVACRMASHILTVAGNPLLHHVPEGKSANAQQAQQRMKALKLWSVEVLRCSQLPDARDQVGALLGKLVPLTD